MRIGVDIDGVLNYGDKINLAYGSKFCVENSRGKIEKPDAHDLKEVFGWDSETLDEYWRKYGKYQMIICPAALGAAEVIRKLRADGHEIWIITGRNNGDQRINGMTEDETWEEVTKKWLERNEIVYDRINFDLWRPAPADKGTFCRENGVDVMIEDLPEYLVGFDEQTKVLIYDHLYNRGVELPNAERVYTWYDVYDKIKKMEE